VPAATVRDIATSLAPVQGEASSAAPATVPRDR